MVDLYVFDFSRQAQEPTNLLPFPIKTNFHTPAPYCQKDKEWESYSKFPLLFSKLGKVDSSLD